MSMDVTTRPEDMTVVLHLYTVTVEDRARPDDSPFRCVFVRLLVLWYVLEPILVEGLGVAAQTSCCGGMQ